MHNTQGGQKVSKPNFSLNVISFLLVLDMGGFMVVRTYLDKNDSKKSCPVGNTMQHFLQQYRLLLSRSHMCVYVLYQIYKYTLSSNTVQWILNQAYSANKWLCLKFI